MRILIAEDDPVIADGLVHALKKSGCAVDHVSSGTEADAAWVSPQQSRSAVLSSHPVHILDTWKSRTSVETLSFLLVGNSAQAFGPGVSPRCRSVVMIRVRSTK